MVISQKSINLKITSVQEFKAFSIKMIKALKEDLSRANQDYVY